MQIFVKSLDGTVVVDVSLKALANNLVDRIEDVKGIPANEQRLTFDGKQLEVCHGSIVGLNLSLCGGGKDKLLAQSSPGIGFGAEAEGGAKCESKGGLAAQPWQALSSSQRNN